jgi:hypothetical protein
MNRTLLGIFALIVGTTLGCPKAQPDTAPADLPPAVSAPTAASSPPTPVPTASAPLRLGPPAEGPTPGESGTDWARRASFADALAFTMPMMTDVEVVEGRRLPASKGTEVFVMWATYHPMSWKDSAGISSETSFAQVKKAPAKERGKRMCVSGEVRMIRTMGREGVARDNKIWDAYEGMMMTDADIPNIVHFFVVGDTGKIVEGTKSRVCGVVTELFEMDMTASIKMWLRGVTLVGLFDLPANRRTR